MAGCRLFFYLVGMKFFGFALLLMLSIASAQLVRKKAPTAADSIDLSGRDSKNRPLVYTDSAGSEKNKAMTDATAQMDSRQISNDSIVGTLIGVGAEFVGDMMKGMLSPNSDETNAVELERTRR